MSRPLRLAVYGTICAVGGSTATAFFRIVEEWVRTGHTIDLYSPSTFIDPAHLRGQPGFGYVPVDLPEAERPLRFLPARGPAPARVVMRWGLAEVQRVVHESRIADAIAREHRARPYDALVSMNLMSRFALQDVLPVVSFPQGPPRGESEFVRRERRLVRRECGWAGWAALRAGYMLRDPSTVRMLDRSTAVAVSSEWARAMFERAGLPRSRSHVVFPPVDLTRFVAAPRPADPDRFTFLWLGRVVPRKRFPLALAAFAKLRERRPAVRLVVIGNPGYGGTITYRLPPLVDGAVRGEPVPHDRVPELMARTDVLLQPSENENFGGSAAEALACGVPSVIGPTNGTVDALERGAFLFDRYDPESVAAAMERAMDAVLADPRGVAARARAIAERNLSLPAIGRRAADLVRDVSEAWRAERGLAMPA